MKDVNNTNKDRNINQKTRTFRFECQCSKSIRRYVRCGKPATHIVQGQDEDGLHHMLLCRKHTAMFDPKRSVEWSGVIVSDVETAWSLRAR